MYVTDLAAPGTVNTMPRRPPWRRSRTTAAPPATPLSGSYDDAARLLGKLKAAGIDFNDVTDQLEREGLAKFEASWAELTDTVAAELERNHPGAGSAPR